MTVLMGYLFTSWFVWGFSKWRSRHSSELWIPFEFVIFFFLILFGAVFREHAASWAAHAFDETNSLAWFGLFAFGIGFPVLVFLDFMRRMWFRKSK